MSPGETPIHSPVGNSIYSPVGNSPSILPWGTPHSFSCGKLSLHSPVETPHPFDDQCPFHIVACHPLGSQSPLLGERGEVLRGQSGSDSHHSVSPWASCLEHQDPATENAGKGGPAVCTGGKEPGPELASLYHMLHTQHILFPAGLCPTRGLLIWDSVLEQEALGPKVLIMVPLADW